MEEIFKIEFHPVDGPPQRIRFLERATDEDIERSTEERRGGKWVQIEKEVVDYFEYSDADADALTL